jgi:hypothetical protein
MKLDQITNVQYGDDYYITYIDIDGKTVDDVLCKCEEPDLLRCDICNELEDADRGIYVSEPDSNLGNAICNRCLEAAFLRINKRPMWPGLTNKE